MGGVRLYTSITCLLLVARRSPGHLSYPFMYVYQRRVRTNTGTAITATSTFAPLLSVHLGTDEEYPQSALLTVHYHNEMMSGCCTQSAVLETAADEKTCLLQV